MPSTGALPAPALLRVWSGLLPVEKNIGQNFVNNLTYLVFDHTNSSQLSNFPEVETRFNVGVRKHNTVVLPNQVHVISEVVKQIWENIVITTLNDRSRYIERRYIGLLLKFHETKLR